MLSDANRKPNPNPFPGSRRGRILDYIASHGGELRSDSGTGLRRQIAEALGERPTAIGQALVGLEKAGYIERELDIARLHCHAIRLVPEERWPVRNRKQPRTRHCHVLGWGLEYGELLSQLRGLSETDEDAVAHAETQVQLATEYLRADRDRLKRQLEETEQELGAAIRRGLELALRVEDLESRLQAGPRSARRTHPLHSRGS